MSNLTGSIELTALTHVEREMNDKNGEKIKVLIIPIKSNNLVSGQPDAAGKCKRYLPVFCPETKEDKKDKADYWILQGKNKDEQHEVPFLGSLKSFGGGSATPTGAVQESSETKIDDDLPF